MRNTAFLGALQNCFCFLGLHAIFAQDKSIKKWNRKGVESGMCYEHIIKFGRRINKDDQTFRMNLGRPALETNFDLIL